MELEIQWDGNPSIVLDVKTRLGVALPIQVQRWFHKSKSGNSGFLRSLAIDF